MALSQTLSPRERVGGGRFRIVRSPHPDPLPGGEGDGGQGIRNCDSSQRDALELVRRRDWNAFLAVLLQLVAPRADRDAEDRRRLRAVAGTVLPRLDDEI